MDKYLENLVLSSRLIKGSAVIEVNDEFKEKIIEDLQEISFLSLYSHLLIKFYNAGIFEKNGIFISEEIINKVNEYFFIRKNNKFSEDYSIMKLWLNNIYRNELKDYTPMIFELYGKYMNRFWIDFISENEHSWLYVDTDCAFISGSIKSLDLIRSINIPFEVANHEFFYIEAPKKVVIMTSNNINVKGHRFKPDEVISIMKCKQREKKLNILLND